MKELEFQQWEHIEHVENCEQNPISGRKKRVRVRLADCLRKLAAQIEA